MKSSDSHPHLLSHLRALARKAETGFPPPDDEPDEDEVPIVVRLVDAVLAYALDQNAEAIRLVLEDNAAFVELETSGKSRSILGLSRKIGRASSARLKILAILDIAEKERPQTGSLDARHPRTGKTVRAGVRTEPDGRLETVTVSFG